jgi:hypothetical protein
VVHIYSDDADRRAIRHAYFDRQRGVVPMSSRLAGRRNLVPMSVLICRRNLIPMSVLIGRRNLVRLSGRVAGRRNLVPMSVLIGRRNLRTPDTGRSK